MKKTLLRWWYLLVVRTHAEGAAYSLGRLRAGWWKLFPPPEYYRRKKPIRVLREGVDFQITASDYMQWHVLAGRPDNSWRAAGEYLRNLPGQANLQVLDVGANCGAFSLKLAAFFKRNGINNVVIHAFEPNPAVLEVLEKNCALNEGLRQKIFIQPFGLGATEGVLPFSYSNENTGGGRFIEHGSSTTLQLPMKTLDQFVEQTGEARVAFVKIDVEGHEPEVLRGAEKTLAKFRPALYLEMTDSWFKQRNSSCVDLLNYLAALGYSLWLDIETGFAPIPLESMKNYDGHKQFNLLATHG